MANYVALVTGNIFPFFKIQNLHEDFFISGLTNVLQVLRLFLIIHVEIMIT